MALVNPYLSIISLNVNELNSPIKRQRLAEDLSISYLQKTDFTFFVVYLFFERERDRAQDGEGQRERERENPKQAPLCQHRV